MIRLHGLPVSKEEASDLARRLRTYGDPHGIGVAERLERGVLMGTAIVATSRPEAVTVLNVIERWAPERLRDVARSLRDYTADPQELPKRAS